VDTGASAVLPANGGLAFTAVPPGSHELRIAGVATNCTVGGGLNQRVTVTAGAVTTIRLTITCVTRGPGIPSVATLEVRTNTTGIELDPNGYSVFVSNPSTGSAATSLFLPIAGSIKLELPPGSAYLVVLSGVALNCHVADDASLTRYVMLVARETTTVMFGVFCQPTYPARLPAGSQLAFVRDGKIHLVNSDGTGVVKLTDGPDDCHPAWSPDGLRLAFVRGCSWASSSDIYIVNADGSNLVRRTQGSAIMDPVWSPDGTRIAFSALGGGSMDLYVMSADDNGQVPALLVGYPGWEGQPTWSPDGKTIAFVSDREFYDFTSDVFVVTVAEKFVDQLTRTVSSSSIGQFYEPAWSRDGTMLAVDKCVLEYYTCDSGTLAVMEKDGSAVRDLAFIRGWASPTWSPDDRTIAFGVGNIISWIHEDASTRGFIVDNGHSPAWRPATPARRVRASR